MIRYCNEVGRKGTCGPEIRSQEDQTIEKKQRMRTETKTVVGLSEINYSKNSTQNISREGTEETLSLLII